MYLHASDNNRAATVFKLFLAAARIHGWPSRVRSDYGGENVEVARAMLLCRGTDRVSHITGSSGAQPAYRTLMFATPTTICFMNWKIVVC